MATITGTSGADRLSGTLSADTIYGLDGDDVLTGRAGSDRLEGGAGRDTLNGGAGIDSLSGGDGADTLVGGRGNDTLSGGLGNDVFLFSARDGQDKISDFAAGDQIKISGYSAAQSVTQVGTNVVVTLSNFDKITVANASVAGVTAALQFDGSTGGGTPGSTITGTAAGETLNGTAGNDVIYGLGGYDEIRGGDGNDRLYGGADGDGLYGGAGADVFAYAAPGEAPNYGLMYYEWDIVYDFQSIDKIDVSALDANALISGNQAFRFAGYIDSDEVPTPSAGAIYIRSDGRYADIIGFTDNDAEPDFYLEIMLGSGQAVPTVDNLIL